MILTQKAITAINNTPTRLKLALALGFTEQWIIKLIDTNKENSLLTTAKALQVIKGETKMDEAEILEERSVEVVKA